MGQASAAGTNPAAEPRSEAMFDPAFDAEFEGENSGDNRPSIYKEGEAIVYRASSLGNCFRELVGLRFGLDPAPWPAKFRKAFADGHRGEDVIVAQLESRGFTITRRQYEINWQVLPGVILRGHLDGMSQWQGEAPCVFDAKTTGDSGISASLLEKYDWQLSTYCHAMNASRYMLGVGTKDRSGNVAGDVVIEYKTPGKTVAEIKSRIARIEAAAKRMATVADLPPCDTENRYPCSLYRYHDDEKPVVIRTSTDEILEGLAEEYETARADEAAAKKRKDAARAQLVEHLGGERDKESGEWSVRFTGTGLRKQQDKKALAKFLAAYSKTIEEFDGTVGCAKTINVTKKGE